MAQAAKAKEDAKKPLVESKSVKNIVNKYIGEHVSDSAKQVSKTAAEKAEEEIMNFNGRKHLV